MNKKIIVLFVVCMIITLPVYSASAFASINNVGIFGNDEVEGYRKENDLTYIKADVSISGDDNIKPEQVFFNDIQFNNCRASEDYFTCVLGINKNTLEAKKHSFTIKLKDDSENTVDTHAGTFIVDAMAPTIDSFSISPKITKKGNVTVKYGVRDYAYETSMGSGLSKIIICKNDIATVVKEININGSSSLDSKEFSFKTSDFVSSTDSADVCIIAYDMLGQSSELTCEKLTVDEKNPQIETSSLEIVDNEGNEIDYISTNPKSAIVSIKIEDESLTKVTGDLSELNNEVSYSSKEAVCIGYDGVYECAWPVTIKLSDSGKVSIKIKAEDGVGNSAEKSASHTFKFDNTEPVVKSIKNNKVDSEGVKYLGKNNNIILEIEEKDSGLNLGNTWIRIGSSKIKADDCVEDGSTWECSFNDINIQNNADGASSTVSVSPDSEDDVGNAFDLSSGISSETFVVDTKAPLLVGDIEIKNLENRSYSQNEFVSRDKLQIKAILKEKTKVSAFADLSAIGLGKTEQASCTQEENNWVCEWNTAEIGSGPINGKLYFTFTDFVGNNAEKSVDISVLGLDDEENPDYWFVKSVEKMPIAIDRQTTELINQKQYVHVSLSPIYEGSEASILAMDLDCSGDISYIQDYELINKDSQDPYIVLTLNQEEMPENSLSINCKILLISKVCGNTIMQNIEEEPVDFTIDFYNMPLGELGQNVKDKIKDAQDSWLVKQEWIGTLEKILNLAEKICSLLGTWGKVNNALADIEEMATIFGWGFADTIKNLVEKSDDMHQKFMDSNYNFCKYISCDKTIWGGWYDDFSSKNTPEIFKEMRFGDAFWPSSPEDSIVLSLATGCIPGIIHGLQKRRQVECYYVLCLKNAASEGISLSVCDEQKAYLECMFIYGEIFQVIPFAGFFKGLAGHVETIFSDPLGLIFGGLNFYCKMQPAGAPHAICVISHLVPTLASIAEDIVGFVDADSWSLSGDVCEEALKPMPETTEEDEEDTEETDNADESTQDDNEGEDETD